MKASFVCGIFTSVTAKGASEKASLAMCICYLKPVHIEIDLEMKEISDAMESGYSRCCDHVGMLAGCNLQSSRGNCWCRMEFCIAINILLSAWLIDTAPLAIRLFIGVLSGAWFYACFSICFGVILPRLKKTHAMPICAEPWASSSMSASYFFLVSGRSSTAIFRSNVGVAQSAYFRLVRLYVARDVGCRACHAGCFCRRKHRRSAALSFQARQG